MSSMTSQRELDEVLLELLPEQGSWGEEEYIWLTDRSNRLIDFTAGYIEVVPPPTSTHQGILLRLVVAFFEHLRLCGGEVLFAPFLLRLSQGKWRTPDLLALLDKDDGRSQGRYWTGADLVLEVVSPDKPGRDLVEKRQEYAEAGIPEYWIVNPFDETITVLTLGADRVVGNYAEHGVFGRGHWATSPLLVGFGVDVNAVFDAE
ncbi:MAG TPA: Uma2 family endonuclease [Thermomicrobiales bacterium]|jgi:Uma2 family endonuclease